MFNKKRIETTPLDIDDFDPCCVCGG